jgi:hypothetical protein
VFEVYGDSAYADGATLDEQTARGHDMRTKVPPVRNANGYSKDRFRIDLAAGTVTCPAHHTVAIRAGLRQVRVHEKSWLPQPGVKRLAGSSLRVQSVLLHA